MNIGSRNWLTDNWIVFVVMLVIVVAVDIAVVLQPTAPMLPQPREALGFLSLLWQIQVSFAALLIATASLIVTVIANQTDRSYTWRLYAKSTRFLWFVWANVILIIAGGLVVAFSLPSEQPAYVPDGLPNLMLTHGIYVTLVLVWAAVVLTRTIQFMDESYVDTTRKREITAAMARAALADIRRQRNAIAEFRRSWSTPDNAMMD
jgi:hypothetical protein